MGARKGKSRCLPGSPGKQSICGTFFSLLWGGGGFFHIEGLFSGAIFSMRGGGGGFSHYVQNILGAHALVAE